MTNMNSDIKQAVSIIRQRIANLQQIERMLLDEFDVPGASAVAIAARPVQHSNGAGNGHGKETQKDKLTKFLIEHGPSPRAKIIAESGIPMGTISNLLNKSGFTRRGKTWRVEGSSATQEITH
jgi:hypothetical protein